jgi:hypothetical protein
MKIINVIMIVAVAILIYSYIGMDNTITNNETLETQKSVVTSTSANQTASSAQSTSTAVTLQTENTVSATSANTSSYANTNSSYYKNNSSYDQSNSNYTQNSASNGNDERNVQSNSNINSSNSSYSQNNPSSNNSGSPSSQSASTAVNSDSQANQDNSNGKDSDTNEEQDASDDDKKTENPNGKFQRIYDNGIVWYGDTGSLTVEYQSSSANTTGIGFRAHYDSSSMRVTNVTQYPVDAITATSAASSQSDARNYDDNEATDNFLTFAWASIYGQWPQTNQVSLATIEFERVNGGSSNYNVAYTAISTSAGYQFIR